MTIRIYNSLTKTKEEFQPIDGKTIRMYACGVTVYDVCHIGHARSLYVFDVIRNYLKYRGYAVQFVRNITDIDDKIINKANELNQPSSVVSERNIDLYYQDLKTLQVGRADIEPKATENIPEMIAHIQTLIDKGFAYPAQGDVYFNVRRFKEYGKLSGQSVEHMMESVRIENDPRKQDPLDFALWKSAKDGEPYWESPWGRGRPGWHIECSCMSMKHLKTQTLDIHAGGRDLIFPHHENEVAQSEAYTGKVFAKYWIHHGLLTINGQKMAKSLGNFITIQDAVAKYGADVLKVFFLASHYASNIDFTEQKMEDARRAQERIVILLGKLNRVNPVVPRSISSADVQAFKAEFVEAMDDDFNTPKLLAVLFNLVNFTNRLLEEDGENPVVGEAAGLVREILSVTGLKFDQALSAAELSSEEEKLLAERVQVRAQKNFKRSDELRDLLKGKGIVVEDSKEGQTWRRV